ncbi:glycosyltransferase family 4 protein [Deinococcus pimensis]|uniref:glycosyltransferase family 4 protein n=1 Tax=Deinococcus pimensis TaxID=309888 RepID=UPI000483F952|nr:glycosyltransferase family 4 protein [Deinococcus pimensis]
MHVVFVVSKPFSLAYGGMEVQVLETRRYLERLGVRVTLLDAFDRDALRDVDLVHFFGPEYAHWPVARMLTQRGLPYVISTVFYVREARWRGAVKRALTRVPHTEFAFTRRLFEQAARLLPNSHAEAEQVRTYWGQDGGRIRVVPNGVQPLPSEGGRFRALHLGGFVRDDERFLLAVGRIDRRKNTLRLVEAALRTSWPLVLVGPTTVTDPDDAAYVTRVLELAARHPDRVRHVGALPSGSPELGDAYRAAHAHALVSINETTGLVSLEAGLTGANLVVGRCPPVEEYFGDLAFIAEPTDLDDVAWALDRAMRLPRDFHDQARRIRERYSWDRVASVTLGVYREVLDGNP